MPMPVMTIANATATGDMIVGPGALTSMVKGLPIACLGDAVAGAACVGAITGSPSPNVLAKGRPVACMTSPVSGVNPAIGIPMTTVCAVTPNVNDIF